MTLMLPVVTNNELINSPEQFLRPRWLAAAQTMSPSHPLHSMGDFPDVFLLGTLHAVQVS